MSGIVVLSGFICFQGPNLLTEWQALQQDRINSEDSVVIGYPNISPDPSFAEAPIDWYQEDGEIALLWARWEKNQGHTWYQFSVGELDLSKLRGPAGRDVVRAIDQTIVEVGGGTYWERIPDIHEVAGFEINGKASAYPLRVLQKVEVVNDLIDNQPYLVVYYPFHSSNHPLQVYEATHNGERLCMGLSGYFMNRRALLYDRGTESFWKHQESGLFALAGPLTATTLRRVAQPDILAWKEWKSRHPTSRLIVGANRDRTPTISSN